MCGEGRGTEGRDPPVSVCPDVRKKRLEGERASMCGGIIPIPLSTKTGPHGCATQHRLLYLKRQRGLFNVGLRWKESTVTFLKIYSV